MTKGQKFRLSQSTYGLDSGKQPIQVPIDSVVEVLTGEVDDHRMVEVDWQGTRVMLFAVDVQDRGIPVASCQRARKKGTNFGAIGGHQGAMASDRR